MVPYQPCFQDVSDDWRERWNILRTFLSTWYEQPFRETGKLDSKVAEAEKELELNFPPSVCEWISLNYEMRSLERNLFRDDFELRTGDDDRAIMIHFLCEGDIAWGVRKSDFENNDPPVIAMDPEDRRDRDSKWSETGVEQAALTEWVLAKAIAYLSNGTWLAKYRTEDAEAKEILQQLSGYYDRVSKFGEYRVFESENMIAFHRCRNDKSPDAWSSVFSAGQFNFHFRKPYAQNDIPAFFDGFKPSHWIKT